MNPTVHYLKDYRAPEYLVPEVDLSFDIFPDHTDITACLHIVPQAGSGSLKLQGEAELLALSINGEALAAKHYTLADGGLTVHNPPAEPFELGVQTRVRPQENTSLNGLYASGGNLYTQCEPEGFRKITFHPDRPDVMGVYTTRICADEQAFPVLLSNGNLIERGKLENGRHYALWHDPFAKPSYLFALVAGDLAVRRDVFVTRSGREVALEFYTREADADKTAFAIESLKHAMKWDETRFGLEYDLDVYMVVAVGDFNMGAMENKGLNIFNTKYVLADSRTATDEDFDGVESVIAHEYFHNWTGNRITCRDWFQLSLKEGLTVFRDQEFSADRSGREVRRIANVSFLRAHQFPEDAGPMAHPVRPESYVEMNNFYTMTVYEKGAEVVRMYHSFLGEAGFQKGMKLYVDRHDGQAVTCDDFRAAMADANSVDFEQFALWYAQAGTPLLQVSGSLKEGTYRLNIRQSLPDTPDMAAADKKPMMMPFALALFDENGGKIPFRLPESKDWQEEAVLTLNQAENEFVLALQNPAAANPVPSLLRGFSAPVKLDFAYRDDDLALLLAHDDDAFSRWEAAQTLYRRAVAANLAAQGQNRALPPHDALLNAVAAVLAADIPPDLKTALLSVPPEAELWDGDNINPVAVHQAREALLDSIAARFAAEFAALDQAMRRAEENADLAQPFEYHPEQAARRALRNLCRAMRLRTDPERIQELADHYASAAHNMTHEWGMLCAANHNPSERRNQLLAQFAAKFADEELVLDKYFALIGSSRRGDTVEQVQAALNHPAFKLANPNKARALLGSFARNVPHFHAADGSGYAFVAAKIGELDAINPQTAAALARSAFSLYPKLETQRRALMETQLRRLMAEPNLSKDLGEVVAKILA